MGNMRMDNKSTMRMQLYKQIKIKDRHNNSWRNVEKNNSGKYNTTIMGNAKMKQWQKNADDMMTRAWIKDCHGYG